MFRFTDKESKIMMGFAALFSFGAGGLIPVYVYYVGQANQFITEVGTGSDV